MIITDCLLLLLSNSPPGSGPDWPGRPSSSPHSKVSQSQTCPPKFHFWQVPAPPSSGCSSSHWLPRLSWGTKEQVNMRIQVFITSSLHLLVLHLIVHICSTRWIKKIRLYDGRLDLIYRLGFIWSCTSLSSAEVIECKCTVWVCLHSCWKEEEPVSMVMRIRCSQTSAKTDTTVRSVLWDEAGK